MKFSHIIVRDHETDANATVVELVANEHHKIVLTQYKGEEMRYVDDDSHEGAVPA